MSDDKTLSVNPDLYRRLIDFAEENFSAFLQRLTESGMTEEEAEKWFDAEK